ncbi:ABC transporter permease [Pedobacter metabolipauper]|uniref:ABC-type antimicrobial peptide transport system permease subunit n=1 Tax=Pedobacter metabolipauper TaxID=425513 RepID=A0A4R6SYK2_9SPHI|nr:ABC transporter permease [Pedobacter metabolipauper]TDQ11085.1 ABC-type antimicrobial peptide transport system permease subunit [Pedobacter metabolipauper]
MHLLSFKIAVRNLLRNKGFTFINLGGFAIGLSACLILFLYVSGEYKFDRYYKNSEHIYEVKVNFNDHSNHIIGTGAQTPDVLAETMRQELSGIKNIAKITWPQKSLIGNNNNSIKVDNRFADPDILKIFTFEFLSGNPEKAFSEPNSIILSETAAKRLFGSTDVLNQVIRFENSADLNVTGIIRDLPDNVSYRFESLVSLNENLGLWPKGPQWGNYSFYTLLTLNDHVNVAEFNPGFRNFLKKHDQNSRNEPFIYPLLANHLNGEFINGQPSGGRFEQVKIFIGLGIGILLIACINFMNLATARSTKRAKEVGIRKTIGATKISLISQYLLESTILVFCSLIIAIILVEITLPTLNSLISMQLKLGSLSALNWAWIILTAGITGILSGSYPAFYLSAFEPVQTLKNNIKSGSSFSINFRKALVIVQFGFAVFLITGTIIIYKQLQHIKNRPTGYDNHALIQMPQEGALLQKYDLFKTKLLVTGAVTSICQTSGSIALQNSSTQGVEWPGMSELDKTIGFNQIFTGTDFVKTTGVKLISGRDFQENSVSDNTSILLNHTAIKQMNLKDPIGKLILFQGIKRTVVGVFEDIIWGNPSRQEMPMVIAYGKFNTEVITMRLNSSGNIADQMETIRKISKEINPAYPVDIKFVDELYQSKLDQERVLSILSNLFSGLSIFISCLGLLGLSAYSAELRTKEIGIRKVLGASTKSLIQLLSFEFIKMVLLAILIALPVTYILMNIWLSKFDFHIAINWFILILSSLFTLVIAFLTVSQQAYKAATANPAEAIKSE